TPEEHDLIIGFHDHGETLDLQSLAGLQQRSPGLRLSEGLLYSGIGQFPARGEHAVAEFEAPGQGAVLGGHRLFDRSSVGVEVRSSLPRRLIQRSAWARASENSSTMLSRASRRASDWARKLKKNATATRTNE